jgi:hypothetical protein
MAAFLLANLRPIFSDEVSLSSAGVDDDLIYICKDGSGGGGGGEDQMLEKKTYV